MSFKSQTRIKERMCSRALSKQLNIMLSTVAYVNINVVTNNQWIIKTCNTIAHELKSVMLQGSQRAELNHSPRPHKN